MKTLLLIRHAKSSWDYAGVDDRLRPLNKRGYQACLDMARQPIIRRNLPNQVLCSPAVRAYTTAQALLELSGAGPVQLDLVEAMYMASAQEIARQIDAQQAETLWVIGHNPGMEMLAMGLGADISAFPTLAVAQFSLPDATLKSAKLDDFLIPRKIIE